LNFALVPLASQHVTDRGISPIRLFQFCLASCNSGGLSGIGLLSQLPSASENSIE
jgi:hypothetical protein